MPFLRVVHVERQCRLNRQPIETPFVNSSRSAVLCSRAQGADFTCLEVRDAT